jgi:SAM-dependent methyltransferase
LFDYLASLCRQKDRAWDVGTGNGQAASMLAEHFAEVVASDASENQIRVAIAHPHIRYLVAPAENTPLVAATVDLITVAQALHWFVAADFFKEVRRVAAPGGVIAAWAYNIFRIQPDIDQVTDHYYRNVVGPFWPPERKVIEDDYRTIEFPFAEIASPGFDMTAEWNVDEAIGYFSTWSSTQRYREAKREDPIPSLQQELAAVWGPEKREVRWPLALRVGRVSE